jgi:CrcB protein
MGWQNVVAVIAGGGIGSLIRYAIAFSVTQRLGPGFPWATLLINVTGSFLIGAVAEITQTRALSSAPVMRVFLMTGVLGGYTTFSSFSYETLTLAYAGGSVVLGVLAALCGAAIARAVSTA